MTQAIPLDIIKALAWIGVKPPPEGKRRTLCPQCSASRNKSNRPCLSIYTQKKNAYVKCHHCGWSKPVC